MKISYLSLLFFTGTLLFAEVSSIAGFLNDNYTGSTANGVSGNYIGSDDFLTFSLFYRGSFNRYKEYHYYRVVTSRKFDYRYDLLESGASYDFYRDGFTITPLLTFIYKGNLGGETIQNNIHENRDIPVLIQDYTDNDLALGLGLTTAYNLENLLLQSDELTGRWDLSVPFGIKPISTTLLMDYLMNFPLVSLNLSTGYKLYINEVEEYSDMVRSGFVLGGQLILQTKGNLSINAGAAMFPVKNLEVDPVYYQKTYDYSPQFWITFGLNGVIHNVMDVINL